MRVAIAIGLIALGLVVVAVSVFGLFRFRNALERLHAGALSDTLGLLLILAGLAVLCGFGAHTAKLVLVWLILWGTNPVSAHFIARMEVVTGYDIEPEESDGEGAREL